MSLIFRWMAIAGFAAIVSVALGYYEVAWVCVAAFFGLVVGFALGTEYAP